jgi:hypothetical protein
MLIINWLRLRYPTVELYSCRKYFECEFGPIGLKWEFKIDYEDENNTINGTTLLAKVDISKFNFYQLLVLQLVYVILDLMFRISMESITCLII